MPFSAPDFSGAEKTAGDSQGHSLASLGFHSVHFFDEYQRSEHIKDFPKKQSHGAKKKQATINRLFPEKMYCKTK